MESPEQESQFLLRYRCRQDGNQPAPPPSTWGAQTAKSGESSGVIAMIDLLIGDLAKESADAKTQRRIPRLIPSYERIDRRRFTGSSR